MHYIKLQTKHRLGEETVGVPPNQGRGHGQNHGQERWPSMVLAIKPGAFTLGQGSILQLQGGVGEVPHPLQLSILLFQGGVGEVPLPLQRDYSCF